MTHAEFIEQIASYVRKYASSYGIKVHSPIIAQAILESGWGDSTLASKYHNYFGLKCGTRWTGKSVNLVTKEEYQPGVLTNITDNFRVFDSMEDGVKGYFDFIQLDRYSNLKGITDPRKYLQTIKDDGYATSSSYVDSCMNVITSNNLTRFDTTSGGGNMPIYIAQASCDENGKYVGGQAGNQSGTELNTRQLWDNKWLYLITWNNASHGEKCAEAASQAVANMHIGYDQYERNTILPPAELVAYVMSRIVKDCECDCTSLASVCAMAAGASKAIMYEGGNLAYTGNIADRLKRTGLVTVQSNLTYDQIKSKATVGSILVSDGHCVIVISSAASGGSGSSTQTVIDSSIDELARAVITGRIPVNPQRRQILGDKYDAVQARVNELLSGTANAAGTSTGQARIIAGAYKVIVPNLNVRTKPSLSGQIVAHYSLGEIIYSIGADVVEADGYTWAHYTDYGGTTRYVAVGTVSGSEKYLAKI